MRQAKYEILEDGTYYGEIPGIQGVWANAGQLAACRDELQEVLEEWLLLMIADGIAVPIVEGINLNLALEHKRTA